MKRVHRRWLASVLVMLPVALCADEPTTRPTVPALEPGSNPSFIAEGTLRFTATNGLMFRVASDGERQRCVLWDASDGTPIFISDGQRSFVYDLENERIVLVPSSRGYMRILWDFKQPKPLATQFGIDFQTNPEKLRDSNSAFRIDRYLAEVPSLKSLEGDAGRLFTSERDGKVETVEIVAGGDGYRFTAFDTQEKYNTLELEVSHIGEALPQAEFVFPSLEKLAAQVKVEDFTNRPLAGITAFLAGGRGLLAKLGIAAGKEMRETMVDALPKLDWAATADRDKAFGEHFRAALAAEGIEFRRNEASSQPVK